MQEGQEAGLGYLRNLGAAQPAGAINFQAQAQDKMGALGQIALELGDHNNFLDSLTNRLTRLVERLGPPQGDTALAAMPSPQPPGDGTISVLRTHSDLYRYRLATLQELVTRLESL